jgi:hypothetical protein
MAIPTAFAHTDRRAVESDLLDLDYIALLRAEIRQAEQAGQTIWARELHHQLHTILQLHRDYPTEAVRQ